jgi:hypothetical protein
MRHLRTLFTAALGAALVIPSAGIAAQTPAKDPSARLREVLPADVADRVIARIAEARARELPAQALENRALKYASRGVAPAEIERSIRSHADRMGTAKDLLEGARSQRPTADEVDAGAEALRQGVDGAAVKALATSAPSGRSLAVPLFVIGSLVERGLPSDSALARVRDRLTARATDAELETMASSRNAAAGANGQRGLDRAAAARPAGAGNAGATGATKAPPNVPRNGGKATTPTRPTTPARPGPGRP